MDKSATPSLLPIFRSQQQAEILYFLLAEPEREVGLTEIAARIGVPYASAHREVERAEKTGLVVSRKIGRTRVVRANVASPYYASLVDLLTKAFGPAFVLSRELRLVAGVDRAMIFGSWAAGYSGVELDRPVGDIDVLVLGKPDRDQLYEAVRNAEVRVGREVQVTVRSEDWLSNGSGIFHANVLARPTVELDLSPNGTD